MVRLQHQIRAVVFGLLAFGVIALTMLEASAAHNSHSKRHRSHHHHRRHRGHVSRGNPEKNRRMAIEFLRVNSPSLTRLANLDPAATPTPDVTAVRSEMLTQSEMSDDEIAAADTVHEIQEPEDIAELEQYDDVQVDINAFRKVWLNYVDSSEVQPKSADLINRKALMAEIVDWLGTRYHYGGTARGGIDCSGFTRMLFESIEGFQLPRSAHDQFQIGSPVDRDELKFGDLIFFHTRRRPFVSHVGVYLGENLFAHSSSRYGVTISSLESTYYSTHFLEGRRIVEPATAAVVPEPKAEETTE